MSSSKASFLAVGAAALLALQSCVEYVPVAENPVPPQPAPQSYPTQPYTPPYTPPLAPPSSLPEAPPPSPPVGADDSLLAPIALYPDPLIAIILPASTQPSEISAAADYLVQYGDASQIDSQPWDPSVRALAHYPAVIAWMANNMAWTEALGSAFSSSQPDVMDSIQRLRARAEASGALTSTAQQQVLSDEGDIEILPAQPDAVFIPVYDDSVVYSDVPYSGYGGPFINFGSPCPEGIWLSYSFDWRRHRVWDGGHDNWHEHDGWRPPHFDGDRPPPGSRPWHPPLAGRQPGHSPSHPGSGATAPAPRPMPGAPNPPPLHYRQSPPASGQTSFAPRGAPPAPQSSAPPAPRSSAPPAERPRLNLPGTPSPATAAPGVRPQYSESRPPDAQPRYTPPQREPAYSEGSPGPRTQAEPATEQAPARGEPPPAASRPKDASPPARAAPVHAPPPPPPTPNPQQR
jgi:Protein of unknown function (DUF3300)